MQPAQPTNDAPLPPFLQGAAANPSPGAPDPATPESTSPERVVPLLIPKPPRGEAALAGLPITGLTRRRIGWTAVALLSVWILLLFARQVGDAQAAQARAEQIRRENAALSVRVDALVRERELVQAPAYIALEARRYGFGSTKERPFALAPGAPSLPPDAPGSATQRVGTVAESRTPLDSWLELLFGPAR